MITPSDDPLITAQQAASSAGGFLSLCPSLHPSLHPPLNRDLIWFTFLLLIQISLIRFLMLLSIRLLIHPSINLPIHPYISLIYPFLYPPLDLLIRHFPRTLSIYFLCYTLLIKKKASIHLLIHPSRRLWIHPSLNVPSLDPSEYRSVSPSPVRPLVSLSTSASVP